MKNSENYMNDVKERLTVYAIGLAGTVVINLFTGSGLWGMIDDVTFALIFISLILMADDVAFRYYNYRRTLCVKYWLGFALELATVSAFNFASKTPSVMWMCIGLVLSGFLLAGVIVYDVKVYNIIEFDEDAIAEDNRKARGKVTRREVKAMKKLIRKFPQMDLPAIKAALYGSLRCVFVDDDVEKDLNPNSPLDPDSMATYEELDKMGAEYAAKALKAKEYIDTVAEAYVGRRDAEKVEN